MSPIEALSLHILANFNSIQTIELNLYNAIGQSVFQKQGTVQQLNEILRVADFTSGIYYLSLQTPNGQQVEKIIIQ